MRPSAECFSSVNGFRMGKVVGVVGSLVPLVASNCAHKLQLWEQCLSDIWALGYLGDVSRKQINFGFDAYDLLAYIKVRRGLLHFSCCHGLSFLSSDGN